MELDYLPAFIAFEKADKQDKALTREITETTNEPSGTYSVIIPAYNEEKRIGPFLDSLVNNLEGEFEILVVFDGNDGTPEVVRRYGERVKLVESDTRLGHGGAVFEGIKSATGNPICVVDADGAIPFYEVKRLIPMVTDSNPVVFGSRWLRSSRILKREHLRNVIGGRIYHYLAFAILGVREKDVFCGLKVFDREVANELVKRITINDRTFNIAIPYHLKLMGIIPAEVGITWTHMDGTKLPVGIKTILFMFFTMIGLRLVHSKKGMKTRALAVKMRDLINFY